MITVVVLLVLLWALGWGFHLGSLVHLLLLVALVVFLLDVIQRRRPLALVWQLISRGRE